MILDFADATPEELGKILWCAFLATRLDEDPELRQIGPRPKWHNQGEAQRALWIGFAARLISRHS